MSKHKCGTCRFYQEARLASSGWCHHPQRKTTSDLMIMVRKNELACRDEWSHDLWEARTEAGSLADSPPRVDHFPDRKMPPATELDIAALVKSGSSSLGGGTPEYQSVTDDVVLSELGTPSEPERRLPRPEPVTSWAAAEARPVESTPPSPVLGSGNRNAIIKAREAFRERSRLEAARLAEIARLASQPGTAAAEEPADASLLDLDQSPDLPATDMESADMIRSSVSAEPNRQAALDDTLASPVDRPLAGIQAEAGPSPRRAEDEEVAPLVDDVPEPSTADQRRSSIPEVTVRATTTPESGDLRAGDGSDTGLRGQSRPPEDLPDSPIGAGSRSFQSAEYGWSTEQQGTRSSALGRSFGEDSPSHLIAHQAAELSESDDVEHNNIETAALDQSVLSDSRDDTSGVDEAAATADLTEDADTSWLDSDVVADDEIETTEQWVESALSAHLPRICQTCRDFRPAESGNRGWCANQWAFTHRRMVDAGDHIPCDGILGHWWAPVDEVWLEAADVSSHGQPTPLLDAWLPHHRDDVPARRRS